jgi:hypothetical protein
MTSLHVLVKINEKFGIYMGAFWKILKISLNAISRCCLDHKLQFYSVAPEPGGQMSTQNVCLKAIKINVNSKT